MKSEWFILIMSALTDAAISAASAIIAVMTATGSPQMPSAESLVIIGLGALVAMGRTIQQALKSTAATTAALRGN